MKMKTVLSVVTTAVAAVLCGTSLAEGHAIGAVKIPKGGYFDTGFIPQSSPKVWMCVARHSEASTAGTCDLFGTARTQRTAGCLVLNDESNCYYYRYGTAGNNGTWSHSGVGEQDEWVKLVCDKDLYVNDVKKGTATVGDFSANTKDTLTIPGIQCKQSLSIAYFKLEDGGVIVRDLVAWQENGTNGLWDVKNEKFYPMLGLDATRAEETAEPSFPTDCTWTGLGGDGLWSNPANWKDASGVGEMPVSGRNDTVILTADTTQDIGDDFSIRQLLFANADANVTLDGRSIRLTMAKGGVAIGVTGGKGFTVCNDLLFENDFYIVGAGTGYSCKGNVNFRGAINAVGKTLYYTFDGSGSYGLHFYGPVTAASVEMKETKHRMVCFHRANHAVGKLSRFYGTAYYFPEAEAFAGPVKPVVSFSHAYCEGSSGRYDLVNDQTFDRIQSDKASKDTSDNIGHYSTTPSDYATLTLKATDNASTWARICKMVGGTVSGAGLIHLVYDPQGDYTQTFNGRTHSFSGLIEVKRGTIRSDAGTTWSNVPKVVVWPGATFEISETNNVANPLPDLQQLFVAKGGTVKVPEGVTLTATVNYDGTWQPAGACSGDWLVGGGTVTAQTFSPSELTWANARGGDWSVAANWMPEEVPDVDSPASVDNTAAEGTLTVTVASAAAPATNLTAGANTPFSGTVAFDVSALWPFTRGWLTFDKGTSVTVKDGGHLFVDDVATGTKDDVSDVRIALKNGSSLTVKSGGTLTYTNAQGRLVVGEVGAATSALSVEAGGTLVFVPGKGGPAVRVGENGRLDVAGTMRLVRDTKSTALSLLQQAGGAITVSGSGVIDVYSTTGDMQGALTFGTGLTRFTDNAQLKYSGGTHYNRQLNIGPTAAGETAEVIFDGNSGFSGSIGQCLFGSSDVAGETHVAVLGNASLSPSGSSFSSLKIGSRYGTSTFDLGHGRLGVGQYGFFVGYSGDATTEARGSGTLSVSNGAALVVTGTGAISRGTCNSSVIPIKNFIGTVVGGWLHAAAAPSKGARPIVGRLQVADDGSSVKSTQGHFVVGAGKAEGTVEVSGGTVEVAVGQDNVYNTSNSNSGQSTPKAEWVYFPVYATNNVMAVGMLGGRGTVELTGGTFTSNLRTFVGGCKTNEWHDGAYFSYGTDKCVANLHDAEGVLRVTGGLFTCTKRVVVGSDGSGLLEIGPSGTFTAPTLVLSNQTASVLSFKADATRGFTGGLAVTNLVIASGATLNVDLGGYAGHSVGLIRAASVEGDFAAVNVTGQGDVDALVRKTPTGYRLSMLRGALLIVR